MAVRNRTPIQHPASTIKDGDVRFQPDSRTAWREWLAANHDTSSGVWLVFAKKHTGIPSLTYEDAVEEALCVGWIDNVRRPIDAQLYQQRFTPRQPKSAWSQLNKARVARMIEQGLMTAAGLALVKHAKRIGTWNALAHVHSLTVPKELRAALDAEPKASANWDAMTPGARKQLLYWLADAKREQTRSTRVKEIVRRVAGRVSPAKARPRPSGRTKAAAR